MEWEDIRMRNWTTLDSVFNRIVRVTSNLSVAMRTFCYTFLLGGLIKQSTYPISLGILNLDESFVTALSKPVFAFIFLDILHPLLYLISLHIIYWSRWSEYKKYEGKENARYDETFDSSELIFEATNLEVGGMNFLPSLFLFTKVLVVIYLMFILISELL